MSVEVIIETENLVKEYKRGRSEIVRAISNINVKFYEAELILIRGESGSGKSTMLNMLSGLDNPTEGTINFMGEDITKYSEKELTKLRRNHVGFIFQSWELIPNLTALENVEVPLYPEKEDAGKIRAKAKELLRRLDLHDEHFPKFPGQLSGGQAQRVGIARALVKNPKVIFADEPTANLDIDNAENIMNLLRRISRQGTTVIVASHNESLKRYADRVIVLSQGNVV
ncbi:MAG: putative ABC transporter ATP-binding protein [Candidatus Heimdallarchaeota archaeon LC_2]|nr:MAG: putative ABC transporter ATP-binding protein [Candidatus Heimdallarchaeota archaeon LC_2]